VVLERVATPQMKIGIFGIGLHAYWDQFPGLKERLEDYQREIEQRLRALGADIISAGLVDTAPAAREAGVRFSRENIDLIVCYAGTYATSSQVVPAVYGVNRPVLVFSC
jgi:L-arabinose isomerase